MGVEDSLIFDWTSRAGINKAVQNGNGFKYLDLNKVKAQIDTNLAAKDLRNKNAKDLVDSFARRNNDNDADYIVGDGGANEWKAFGGFLENYGDLSPGEIRDIDVNNAILERPKIGETPEHRATEIAELDVRDVIAEKKNRKWEWREGMLDVSAPATQTSLTASMSQIGPFPVIRIDNIPQELKYDQLPEEVSFSLGGKEFSISRDQLFNIDGNGEVTTQEKEGTTISFPIDSFLDFDEAFNLEANTPLEFTNNNTLINSFVFPQRGNFAGPKAEVSESEKISTGNTITLGEGVKDELNRSLAKLYSNDPSSSLTTKTVVVSKEGSSTELPENACNYDFNLGTLTINEEITIPEGATLKLSFINTNTNTNKTVNLTFPPQTTEVKLTPANPNGNTNPANETTEIPAMLDTTKNKDTLTTFYTSNTETFNQLGITIDSTNPTDDNLQGLAYIQQIYETAKTATQTQDLALEELLKNDSLSIGQKLQLSIGLDLLGVKPDKVTTDYKAYIPETTSKLSGTDSADKTKIVMYLNGTNQGGIASGKWFTGGTETTLLKASQALFNGATSIGRTQGDNKTTAIKKAALGWLAIYSASRSQETLKEFAVQFLVANDITNTSTPEQRKAILEPIIQTLESDTKGEWTTDKDRKLLINGTQAQTAEGKPITLTSTSWDDGSGLIAAEILRLVFKGDYKTALANDDNMYTEYARNGENGGVWSAENT